MKTSEILGVVLTLIDRFGWIRFEFGDKQQGFCALGAIREAMGHEKYDKQAKACLLDSRNWHNLDNLQAISLFNDRDTTTKENVLELLHVLYVKALAKGL